MYNEVFPGDHPGLRQPCPLDLSLVDWSMTTWQMRMSSVGIDLSPQKWRRRRRRPATELLPRCDMAARLQVETFVLSDDYDDAAYRGQVDLSRRLRLLSLDPALSSLLSPIIPSLSPPPPTLSRRSLSPALPAYPLHPHGTLPCQMPKLRSWLRRLSG
eukprot:340802-Hanusia_phi.AAC.1